MRGRKDFLLIVAGAAIAGAAVFCLSLYLGPEGLSIPGDEILRLRIMRALCGAGAGAALAAAGVAYQTVLANPLADPYLLGSSSGAAAGIAALSFFGVSRAGLIFPLTAGLCSCLTVAAVLKIAGRSFSKKNIILSGVAVNLFLSAAVIFMVSIRKKEFFSVMYFMMGDLGETRISLIAASLMIAAAGSLFLFAKSRFLNALAAGKTLSRQLGCDWKKESLAALAAASVITGAAVSISGTIGFIGLMAPHIARKFTGSDARFLLPAAAATGAILLMISDFAAKNILFPQEIPVGVITAMLGAPFFLWIYRK
ncbi:MAG: iron ABC transporter permease [Candidatus Omnitrophota bacterium]|nr:iron ABC transporter permease [Candidatus Omnitrophota bacterium]MBU2528457.1 iron ABC transporter permease [bacterium]MBU3929811.1 iron ABC transporter permease [bacterium]MBU4122610.1 iron ABC transporter permease [bacterium]